MAVNLTFLLLGLLLLWFPRQWLRFGPVLTRRRRRGLGPSWKTDPWNVQEAGDPQLSFRIEFSKLRNYVDLLRGTAGSLAILGGYGIEAGLAVEAGKGDMALQVLALKLAILFVAVLLQTIRYERRRLSFFPPVFFLAGLSVSLCGPWASLFAFVLIWSVNPMLGNAQAFLSVYALLLGAFGVFFRFGDKRLAIVAAVLCFSPVLLSLLTRRRLGVFTRKGAHPHHM